MLGHLRVPHRHALEPMLASNLEWAKTNPARGDKLLVAARGGPGRRTGAFTMCSKSSKQAKTRTKERKQERRIKQQVRVQA